MAELLVGGAFLSSFLQVAFGKLASKAVIDYFRRNKLDFHLLGKLDTTMLLIEEVIDDAEGKEITDPRVMKWLDKLKEAVYDAEDVLDVISTLDHTYNMKTTFHRLTSKLRSSWNPFDLPIDQELHNVYGELQFLLEQKYVIGLEECNQSSSRLETPMRLPTTSIVKESGVYGRDTDKENIKKLLLSNDGSNGDVIAIVGMGGLGKTTLAQLVFNDDEINRVFKLNKVWICVAEDFDVIKITKTILEKMTSQSCNINDFDEPQMKLKETLSGKSFLIALDDVWNQNYRKIRLQSCDTNDFDLLQTKLKEILSGKKFLIVLDDIWNQNDRNWDELQKPFNFGAPGSKIIITTRNTRVASAMRAISIYKLQVLSDEDCWSLFAKQAFENISPSSHSNFEVVGRKLVKKCRGLPLAARVLGGLLRTKVVQTEEWDEVLNNNIWNSSDEESENKILPVLRLSYHYLPSNLKRCFAFCSLIPKDYKFEREKLVLLWMAESLLPDCGGKKKRDVGYEYLGDLESRSLIQPCSERKSHFKMHDLVNDLATAVSGDFYKRYDIGNSFVKVGKQIRHFSCVMPNILEDNGLARLEVISEAKRLRTLILSKSSLDLHSKILPQLKLIRTLILSKSNMEKLPSSIGNLRLLHCLDLSDNEQLIKLPESVAKLYNLEVLILKGCQSVTKLPSKMRQLTKLNHLDIRDTKSLKEMPLQMGSLKDLDVLTDFVVGKGSGSSIAELKELKYLRGELSIHGLQNIDHPEDALEANLKEKSYLEELRLKWDIDSDNSIDVRIILENLRPHVNLKKLSIWKYSGTRLPDWSGHYYSFVNLVDIAISDFKNCFHLAPLGQLPSLKTLTIWSCYSLVTLLGTEIPIELPNEMHHFSALEYLKISDCPNFEYFDAGKWRAPKMTDLNLHNCESLKVLSENICNIFPSLESLSLYHCWNLEALPHSKLPVKLSTLSIYGCNKLIANRSSWGLQRLPSLSHFEISGFECDDLEFFPEEGLLPNSLSTLRIEDVPNLRNLNGKSFQLLTSLEALQLSNCPKLQCLPRLSTSLFSLYVSKCPLLESQCQTEQSKDWSKIAHIPNIQVDP